MRDRHFQFKGSPGLLRRFIILLLYTVLFALTHTHNIFGGSIGPVTISSYAKEGRRGG